MDGHALSFVQVGIVEEARPEHLDVFHLQGCQQGLLLIDGVVAVVVGEIVEQIELDERVVARESVVGREHVEDGPELLVFLDERRVFDVSLVVLRPVGIVFRLLQDVDVFLSDLVFAIQQGAFQHVAIVVDPPTIFHTVLETPAVAEVQLSVVEVENLGACLRHPHLERGVALLVAVLVVVHLVALSAESEEGEVLHHPE